MKRTAVAPDALEPRDDAGAGWDFVAATHVTVRVKEALEKASRADVQVVLYGEPGVGKLHAAHFLHRSGPRRERPLAVVPLRHRSALAKLAEPSFAAGLAGGGLVLDGVDEASSELQSFLVGAIEEWNEAEEGGSSSVRVVATAQEDLYALAERGSLRKDLCFLLDVFPVALPPLRERLTEIPVLLEHFHRRHCPGAPAPLLSEAFLSVALAYHWPGNLDELENVVEASIAQTRGAAWALPTTLPQRYPEPVPFHSAKREFEAAYVRKLLLLTSGNVTRAAELAQKARKDFYALLSRNGIDPDQFRR